MFVLFNVGEPMTGHRMFESDEEVDDWQVSALAVGSLEMCWSATEYEIDFFESAMLHCIFFWY